MLILLSPAKTMHHNSLLASCHTTAPQYEEQARMIATYASAYTAEQLAEKLKISRPLAEETLLKYHLLAGSSTTDKTGKPAILHYDGVVFKHLRHQGMTNEELLFAQEKIRIASFMYGLLRPLDAIKPYRMEGNVRLEALGSRTMFDFWQPLLTDTLLEEVKREEGMLINLAGAEMKKLFQWKRLESSVTVITPEFKIDRKGALKNIVVYTKMARGEMTRFIIQNRLSSPEELQSFSWEGFRYNKELSSDKQPLFIANKTA